MAQAIPGKCLTVGLLNPRPLMPSLSACLTPSLSRRSGQIECVGLEVGQRNRLQRPLVGGPQRYSGGGAGPQCLLPAQSAQGYQRSPGLSPGKPKGDTGSDQASGPLQSADWRASTALSWRTANPVQSR